MAKKNNTRKTVETLKHAADTRKNIPTAEYQSVLREEQQSPIRIAYERRNRDLDPQLVWRGKDEQDWSDLVVAAPPLYIQEKVHPKVLDTPEDESKAVARWLRVRVDEGITPHEMSIFVRSDGELDRARAAASRAGLEFKVLDEGV